MRWDGKLFYDDWDRISMAKPCDDTYISVWRHFRSNSLVIHDGKGNLKYSPIRIDGEVVHALAYSGQGEGVVKFCIMHRDGIEKAIEIDAVNAMSREVDAFKNKNWTPLKGYFK